MPGEFFDMTAMRRPTFGDVSNSHPATRASLTLCAQQNAPPQNSRNTDAIPTSQRRQMGKVNLRLGVSLVVDFHQPRRIDLRIGLRR